MPINLITYAYTNVQIFSYKNIGIDFMYNISKIQAWSMYTY
jgi:hypothetical protein